MGTRPCALGSPLSPSIVEWLRGERVVRTSCALVHILCSSCDAGKLVEEHLANWELEGRGFKSTIRLRLQIQLAHLKL